MISALLYLQYHSTRNRLRTRIQRLKQPKYLAMLVVGGAYFYFYFIRILFAPPVGRPGPGAAAPETLALLESIAALVLSVIVLLAWLVPHERAALTFSEAEVAFLFPAPLSRRGLIHFKLLRSQWRIFVTIFFLTLISNRFGRSGAAWIHAAGWWLALSTLNLHLLGSSFARTMLLDRGISNWARRGAVLGIVLAGAVAVVVWAARTLPPLDLSRADNLDAVKDYARAVLVSGPMPYVLAPFRLVVRPYFATDALSFVYALGPALLLLALHYAWVIRSNVAFEEASVEASQKLATRIAAARAGNWRTGGPKAKRKRPPFRLQPVGFPPIAILWKNLIGAGQIFSWRLWFILVIVAGAFLYGSGMGAAGGGVMSLVGMLSAMFLVWSLLAGPQLLRQDLRQDLVHADVLKLFPLRGWQIVVGEMLAPAAILTGLQWLLLIFAANVLWKIPRLTTGLGLALAFSIALLLPALNAVMLLIPNAGVLLFPAWFQTGKDGPQGIEATGQRLIMMLGQLLAFLVALIPAAIAFLAIFLVGRIFIGPIAIVLPASFVAALVLAGETWLGVMLLGKVFERFDLSAEFNS